jgi:Holin of 3TMs, for gene-transfer release
MLWDIPQMVTTIGGIVNKFIPDRDAQVQIEAQLQEKLMEFEAAVSQAQNDVNKSEAENPSLFVSGWRPAVGWVCAGAFAWQFVGQPVFSFLYTLSTKQPAPVIALPSDALITVLMGMLGLGGFRTWEKLKGVARVK